MESNNQSPIVQTTTALEIDTAQFCISLPGIWVEHHNPNVDNLDYCGRCGHRWVSITLWLFRRPLTLKERKETAVHILELRQNAEAKTSEGEAETAIGLPYDCNGLAVATAFSVVECKGLVSFTRVMADCEKALCVYWQVDGLSEAPPLSELLGEFEGVMTTAGLYEPDTE